MPPDASFCPSCGVAAPASAEAASVDPAARTPGGASNRPQLPGYTVLERLGAGGSSVVYRARQENLDRDVAVKLIRLEVGDASAWRRFEREARIIAALSGHPHVLTVYDVGRTERGEPFLVTELLDRGSLGDIVTDGGPLDADSVVAVGRSVASALEAAHGRGILHRDVKPGNVLVDSHRQVKLGDFGVARLIAGHTETTTASVAFTPEHVAPEVLRGEPEGPASDVYGLGSTLLTALLGRSPFVRGPDERVEAMMWRKLAEPPPSPPAWAPPELAELVVGCLATAPADRPSLGEVRARLERMAAGAGAVAAGAAGLLAAPTRSPGAGDVPTVPQPTAAGGGEATVAAGGEATATQPAMVAAGGGATVAADREATATHRAVADDTEPTESQPPPAFGSLARSDEVSRSDSGTRSRWWVAAVLALAAVFAAGVVAYARQAGNDEDSEVVAPTGTATTAAAEGSSGPPDTAPVPAPDPPAVPDTEPTATEPPTTEATTPPPPSTTTSAVPRTTTSTAPTTVPPTTVAPTRPATQRDAGRPGDPISDDEAVSFVRDYYDLVASGRYEQAYERLSPEFRSQRSPTFQRYVGYWRSTSLQLRDVRVTSSDDDAVRVRFEGRYVTGQRVVDEANELTVRRDGEGRLVIADQRIVS